MSTIPKTGADPRGKSEASRSTSAPTAIFVEGVGKKYLIRHQQTGKYRTLSEEITGIARRLGRRLSGRSNSADAMHDTWEEFWALRNVSFEVKQGEVVGIIGRNGAGKSTMLKVLSRITAPTEGRLRIRGRLASLLEVGTGFHPELTGRENIFLNGAVLGMTKKETLRKFDEIVAFAEASTFLDTAVKYYSSGMYMRLAFAVAAHLEPEILVVDEVLAVGDIGFQKKCLGKMQGVASSGRTVFFVSHNMQAVRTLCSRCILLDKGRVLLDSSPEDCTSRYHDLSRESSIDVGTAIWDSRFRRGAGQLRFAGISVCGMDNIERFSFRLGESIRFRVSYKVFEPVSACYLYIAILCSHSGRIVTSSRHLLFDEPRERDTKGEAVVEWKNPPLRPGEFPIYFWLGDERFLPFDVVDRLTAPLVIQTDADPLRLGYDPAQDPGYFDVRPELTLNQSLNGVA